jgi:ubiquinone/menaquinone biosynthesis C-methylase UbiE
VEAAGSLDNRIRRWFQNPGKLLRPYVQEGMIVLDMGCGPGFFTLDLARMVGAAGHVIAADLQEGMLDKVRARIAGTVLEDRVTLHLCNTDGIGLRQKVDFALLFYVAHEVPNQDRLFSELVTILRPGGAVLVVEPPFHVSKQAFEETLRSASGAGLTDLARPRMFPNKAAVLNMGSWVDGGRSSLATPSTQSQA